MSTSSEKIINALIDAVGDNAENQAVTQWIDTGYPPLNEQISGSPKGGLPFGRLVEVYGESSTGKTALATKWLCEAQRMGGVGGFIDWERSFNVDMAKNLGLNDKRPNWFYFKPKTWEEGNMLAAKVCKVIRDTKAIPDDAPILWIFDSIAAAIPQSMIEKEMDQFSMNDTTALARVSSTTLKVMAQHAEEFNATFLYLNQIRLKPGVVYGDPRTTPGGKAMEFYASARLALGRTKVMETSGGSKEFTGQDISIQCTKSKFTKPFTESSLRLSFDECGVAHFDMTYSLIQALIEEGALVYSKPRVTWTDGKKYFVKELVEKIESEGKYHELVKMFEEHAETATS